MFFKVNLFNYSYLLLCIVCFCFTVYFVMVQQLRFSQDRQAKKKLRVWANITPLMSAHHTQIIHTFWKKKKFALCPRFFGREVAKANFSVSLCHFRWTVFVFNRTTIDQGKLKSKRKKMNWWQVYREIELLPVKKRRQKKNCI